MANLVTTQIELDGARNTILKVAGVLDTSDFAYTPIILPANLQGMDWTGTIKAKDLILDHVNWSIREGLSVNLFWDATVTADQTLIAEFVKSGNACYREFMGLVNSSGSSRTGGIALSTTGWNIAASPMSFSFVLTLVKTGT